MYDNTGIMQFGKYLWLRYKEDEKTKSITLEDVRLLKMPEIVR